MVRANHKNGFSIIETMVAILLLMIFGTAIISLVLTVVSANTSAKLRNQGISYAEEGVEQARNFNQANGFSALLAKGSNCYADGNLVSTTGCTADCSTNQIGSTNFYRIVQLTAGGNSYMKIQSIVSWMDRGQCTKTEIGTYFYSN